MTALQDFMMARGTISRLLRPPMLSLDATLDGSDTSDHPGHEFSPPVQGLEDHTNGDMAVTSGSGIPFWPQLGHGDHVL